MLKTNEHDLVALSVLGQVAPAMVWPSEVGHNGKVHNVPAVGGICYNVLVGDKACGWAADHIEPAVSSVADPAKRNDKENKVYNFLACVGNEATILNGDAKGQKGIVTGHHGGVEHVMIDFPQAVLNKMNGDEKIRISSLGQGLKLIGYPEVMISSTSPQLLKKMGIVEKKGKLEVPVAHIIPGKLMGSGLGSLNTFTGDFDIMTADEAEIKKLGLDTLKLGDIVAITDMDAKYGWCYKTGAVMIGVIIHGDSNASGHGPGVTSLMASTDGTIVPVKTKEANIGKLFQIGRYRSKKK
ncbi:MAG: DUF4438 domain-containing protein [Deltaproteobacteria bacterium CG_4_10_14_0_2_um_filter_43_8]|nr:MAG: DUF4438 domain-containing protein [Deltaproteobacteria bacterium CG11_big_fil_rev_8_21_14_0_20_42_23]PJA21329.1 MAG: DUF4438 domain-containing protein [Deltaproteobacteria bacterium CG_4_10_14_0_2_um_filter_43_8]PJC64722.1 MAG: DUF4438 domain-containing protein [Deltaproteobacteria bacterium CG_4_9_14_0_2_um_filter_42_21]